MVGNEGVVVRIKVSERMVKLWMMRTTSGESYLRWMWEWKSKVKEIVSGGWIWE